MCLAAPGHARRGTYLVVRADADVCEELDGMNIDLKIWDKRVSLDVHFSTASVSLAILFMPRCHPVMLLPRTIHHRPKHPGAGGKAPLVNS